MYDWWLIITDNNVNHNWNIWTIPIQEKWKITESEYKDIACL